MSKPKQSTPPTGAGDLASRDERWQLRVRGLHRTFGVHHVLQGIDLDIERGKTNIIIGGSGQGKSVLMKHLMGLLKPDPYTKPAYNDLLKMMYQLFNVARKEEI